MLHRSRNWVLTNNYKDREPITDEEMLNTIKKTKHISYTAFQLEQGELGTKHHQIYLHFSSPKTFKSIKDIFPLAHIEHMRGSSEQAVEYCTKTDTRVLDPVTWGEFPEQGKRNDWIDIYNMIRDGKTNEEIRYRYTSQYMIHRTKIQSIRQEVLEEEFQNQVRNIVVIYLSDKTGTGKSRYILEKYGYSNVYRISNYKNPFDSYKGQDVLVFEEFRESIPIESMLNYLDIYPMRLPARYEDKVACYNKVFIVSNWPFDKQYKNQKETETYNAWIRRIHFRGNLEEVKKYNDKEDIIYEIEF